MLAVVWDPCASSVLLMINLLVFRAASATEVNRGEAQQVKDAPKPIVKIDNQHDPFATVVSIQYGNKLGELLDTVKFRSFGRGHLTIQMLHLTWSDT